MKIALFVEGKSDKSTIPILVRKILERESARPAVVSRVRPRGDLLSADKVAAFVSRDILQQHRDTDKIIVCVDSECTPVEETKVLAQETERRLQELGVSPLPRYCVMRHALEGWLGADVNALSDVAGRPVKLSESAAIACRPKELLEEAFRKAGKEFVYVRDDPRIAEKVDPATLERENESFAHFRRLIEGP